MGDQVTGWNVTKGLAKHNVTRDAISAPQSLTARCIEFVSYRAGAKSERSGSLGWHSDGETLLTMAVMLSASSDFSGGAIEFMNDDLDNTVNETHSLDLGDVLAWRGWTYHRVLPVTSGVREVLIVEWWSNADCSESHVQRDGDTRNGLKRAIMVDPTSSYLYSALGTLICKRLPCDDEADAQEAENVLRKAAKLSPRNPRRLRSLALFLGGYEGFQKLHEACVQDSAGWSAWSCMFQAAKDIIARSVFPSVVFEPDSTDEVERVVVIIDILSQVKTLILGSLAAITLWVLIKKLE